MVTWFEFFVFVGHPRVLHRTVHVRGVHTVTAPLTTLELPENLSPQMDGDGESGPFLLNTRVEARCSVQLAA